MNKLIMHLLEVFILSIPLVASTIGSTTITPVLDTFIKNNVSLARNESNIEPFVVGGHDAKPGEFPWIVNIQIMDNTNPAFRTLCGGTLIDLDLIISAAHCVCHEFSNSVVEYQNVQLTAGEYNMSKEDGSEQRISVREIRIHEEFYWDRTTLRNDIALIKLQHKLKQSKVVDKIELPNFDVLRNTQIVRVAGWGDTDSRHMPSDILQTVDIEIWEPDKCNLLDNNLQICAGGNGKDSCLGDSGGPLICSFQNTTYLCGIVSYGTGSICGESPGVYTNVYGYQKWILENQEFSNVFYQVVLAFIVFSIIISSVVGIVYFLYKKFSSPHYCQMVPI